MTLFEVLLTIALVAFTAVMAGPFLSGTLSRNDLEASADSVHDALKEARSSAMSGKGAGKYGVHFEAGGYVLFAGATYNPADPDNVSRNMSGLVGITGINISGGGSDLHFRSVSGSPVETGSVQLTDTTGETKTVSVNEAGMIDVQ